MLGSESLKGTNDWQQYIKSGKKPPDIPSNPPIAYKWEWKDWGDWLGIGMITDQKRAFSTV